MKKLLKDILVPVCICIAFSLLLAVTNSVTAPIIAKNQDSAKNAALLEVMPDGSGFELLDISEYELPKTVTEVYKEASGGYVFKLETTGFASGLVIMCGVNSDGTVSGAVCLASNETWGKEKTFGALTVGTTAETIVDVEAGATSLTVNAYRGAVGDALNAAIILGGGSVDLRTEEEILMDNLSAALPSAEGNFTKLFITEVIEGIDAVYTADNGEGYVFVIGEAMVATDKDGNVVTEAADELAATASPAATVLAATSAEDIDITAYEGLPKQLISAKVTASGNYIIEIKGVGYGIKGGDDYHPASGEYIVIRIAITSDGKVLDCVTVSHGETANIGGAIIENAEYYGQFIGMTKDECGAVDTIAGATYTTAGYTEAVLRAFESVKIFIGGAENE